MLIESARKVVAEHTAAMVDFDTGEYLGDSWCGKDGTILDAFTASAICTVYDALNEKNRKKFDSLRTTHAVKVVWRLVK